MSALICHTRRIAHLVAVALVGAASLLSATRASAQDSMELKKLYDDGRAAIIRGDWDSAYKSLSELWTKQRSGRVAGLLGQAESELGNCPDAIEHLTFALGDLPPDRPADASARVSGWIKACKEKVATLRLDVEPATATVLVNGKPLGSAKDVGKEVFAQPGRVQVMLTQAGYRSARLALEVPAGQSGDVKVALEPESRPETASAAPNPSRETHMTPPSDPSGDTPNHNRNWVPAYVLGGVTIASGVATGLLHVAASNDLDDGKRLQSNLAPGVCSSAQPPADCGTLHRMTDSQRREATWANITLVTTGVALAATLGYVVYELTSSPNPSASSSAPGKLRASMAMSPTSGAVFLEGSF